LESSTDRYPIKHLYNLHKTYDINYSDIEIVIYIKDNIIYIKYTIKLTLPLDE